LYCEISFLFSNFKIFPDEFDNSPLKFNLVSLKGDILILFCFLVKIEFWPALIIIFIIFLIEVLF